MHIDTPRALLTRDRIGDIVTGNPVRGFHLRIGAPADPAAIFLYDHFGLRPSHDRVNRNLLNIARWFMNSR